MLGLLLGDNLGANQILGFVASFSANHCCRFCLCHKTQLHTMCEEDGDIMRTERSYENEILINNYSLTGRKEECVWHAIDSFHVSNNHSVDIMHDLYEGVAPLEIALLLENLIKKDEFTLETLNSRIANFNHGPFEHFNLPQTISAENIKLHHLKYSSSEIKVLMKYLPILIGDLVTENDENWLFFLLLRDICSIIFNYVVTPDCIVQVEEMIKRHHSWYQKLYKRTLIPKHHHMVHYPNIMRLVGPLRNLWSMRGESKHKVMKKIAASTTSRVNICFTVATRHQLAFANLLLKNKGLQTKTETSPPILNASTLYTPYNEILKSCFPSEDKQTSFNWVQIKNIKYKKHMLLVLKINSEGNPEFGIIKEIFFSLVRNNYFFICQEYDTLYFDEHLSSFVINKRDTFCIVFYESLIECKPKLLIQKNHSYVPY